MNLSSLAASNLSMSSMWTPTLLTCTLASFLPIMGWIYFFQKQNHEKKWYVILTFIAGMLAVLPIKLYEKYWDASVLYFENINVFQYLSELVRFPELPKLLSFVTVNALVALGLFVFTSCMMFVLEMVSKDNRSKLFFRKVRIAAESPLFFISIGVICGIFAFGLAQYFTSKIWFFVMVGMLEEYIKHLVLRFSDEEKVRSVDDALSFSILVALGFAFVENIFYFQNFLAANHGNVQQFALFFILRSTISVMAHVCFSAILGYFYGIAKFSQEIYQEEVLQHKHPLIRRLHKLLHLKGETLFHEEKMMEGMLLAMILHALFNSLLEYGKITLMIPMLLTLFYIVLHLFHRKTVHMQIGHIPRIAGPSCPVRFSNKPFIKQPS